jgi:hypothetical protein
MSDLAHELRPRHVDRTINSTRVQTRIVLQNLYHQAGVIASDHACLQHAQQADFALGLAERSAGIDGHVYNVVDAKGQPFSQEMYFDILTFSKSFRLISTSTASRQPHFTGIQRPQRCEAKTG